MRRLLCFFILLLSTAFAAQQSYDDLARHWTYDKSAPLNVQQTGVENRNGIEIHDISYATPMEKRGTSLGPSNGRVTAYLVTPKGKGPFPAVIYGHWCMPGSAQKNRTEFLEEAVVLAHSGVISLLPNHVISNPGFVEDAKPLSPQQIDVLVQQVVNIRRGADLLLARKDVDPNRLGFVGHSCSGQVAAFLSGIDKRFHALVVMASNLSDVEDVKTKYFQDYRKQVGADRFDAFLATYNWADPGKYISQSDGIPKLLQFGSDEPFLTQEHAQKYLPYVSEPKVVHFYDAPHALNAEATRDRITFLASELGFPRPSATLVASIAVLTQPPWPKPPTEAQSDKVQQKDHK
jgi:dienelactone hydrolase